MTMFDSPITETERTMRNRGKFLIERVVRYQCGYEDCKSLWTIADGRTDEILVCPRCGRYQAFDEAKPLPIRHLEKRNRVTLIACTNNNDSPKEKILKILRYDRPEPKSLGYLISRFVQEGVIHKYGGDYEESVSYDGVYINKLVKDVINELLCEGMVKEDATGAIELCL